MRTSMTLAAWLSVVSADGALPNYEQLWSDWKGKWGQSLESSGSKEEGRRFAVFKKKVDFIDEENAKGYPYKLGLNKFSGLTNDEFQKYYASSPASSCEPSGNIQYVDNATLSAIVAADSIDWVEKGAVTPVKDQGDCGSCWSFSTTGAIEGAYQIATGTLPEVAEQQFLDCDTGLVHHGCSGAVAIGGVASAFHWAESIDLCTESTYPYRAEKGSTCKSAGCQVAVQKGSIVSWHIVPPLSTTLLMHAVSQQPVSVTLDAGSKVIQDYESGVITGFCGLTPDHAVLAVGYGVEGGVDYWKIKNSWGDWGEKGYFRLKRKKFSGAGECGVLENMAYPVVASAGRIVV